MPTCYHLHVAGVGILQKCEVDYQHSKEPTHRLRESASLGCRLPILRFPRPGRTDEPTSAHLGPRSSNGNTSRQPPAPSTSDRAPFAQDERQRQRQTISSSAGRPSGNWPCVRISSELPSFSQIMLPS